MKFNLHIKKILINVLLCIYSFAVLNPILPVVADLVDHTFFKMHHMATVHYENGKYHLHAELQKVVDENKTKSKETIPLNKIETLQLHVGIEFLDLKFYNRKVANQSLHKIHPPLGVYVELPTPPPQV